MSPPRRPHTVAALTAGLALAGTGGLLMVQGATFAAAATPAPITDASFAWGLSGEQGGGAFFGGCNFLSAGTAGDTGSSRVWTSADGFYATHDGNVTVEKPDTGGSYAEPTFAGKCQDPAGDPVDAGSTSSVTGNRVSFTGGTGAVDLAAGTAQIAWTGSFTSAFYGGLTYWSAADPVLTVSGGTGTLTATVSGYGADMDDPTAWVTVPARTATLATLTGITLSEAGFSVTPDYLGVAVTTPAGATAQTPASAANAASWGAFPQDFVDFQQLTGQSSYWFSSGGARDAAKVATPLAVTWNVPAVVTTPPATTTTPPVTASPTVTTTSSSTRPPPVSTSPTAPTSAAVTTTAAAASCVPTDAVTAGSLTWGVKKSFRGYVAGAAPNTITAAGGASILASDLAVATRADSGTVRWPFAAAPSYTSPRTFTVAYGGSVTFGYPAHFFSITFASPRLEVTDGVGVLVVDVTSTISAPGSASTTETRDGVDLAAVTVRSSAGSATTGTTVVAGTTVEDTAAFSFNGSAFYQRGAALDDATAVLADCALPDPVPTTEASSAGAGAVAPLDLVPTLQFRPQSLPATGADVSAALLVGVALVVLGATVTVVSVHGRPARGRR